MPKVAGITKENERKEKMIDQSHHTKIGLEKIQTERLELKSKQNLILSLQHIDTKQLPTTSAKVLFLLLRANMDKVTIAGFIKTMAEIGREIHFTYTKENENDGSM